MIEGICDSISGSWFDQEWAMFRQLEHQKKLNAAYRRGISAGFWKRKPALENMSDDELQRFEDGVMVGLGANLIEYIRIMRELSKKPKSLKEQCVKCM